MGLYTYEVLGCLTMLGCCVHELEVTRLTVGLGVMWTVGDGSSVPEKSLTITFDGLCPSGLDCTMSSAGTWLVVETISLYDGLNTIIVGGDAEVVGVFLIGCLDVGRLVVDEDCPEWLVGFFDCGRGVVGPVT